MAVTRKKTISHSRANKAAYVSRPSQTTRKKPTKRLTARRAKTLKAPRGMYANPIDYGSAHSMYTVSYHGHYINAASDKNGEVFRVNIPGQHLKEYKTLTGAKRAIAAYLKNSQVKRNPCGAKKNPVEKTFRVEYRTSSGGGWMLAASFPHTVEGRKNAKEYAEALFEKHSGKYPVKVVD